MKMGEGRTPQSDGRIAVEQYALFLIKLLVPEQPLVYESSPVAIVSGHVRDAASWTHLGPPVFEYLGVGLAVSF